VPHSKKIPGYRPEAHTRYIVILLSGIGPSDAGLRGMVIHPQAEARSLPLGQEIGHTTSFGDMVCEQGLGRPGTGESRCETLFIPV
ncbi:hypothetical protein K1Y78_52980, partial [Streptomyces sp. tea 10]|nr:hypothetical protein [Streptomyces sp. tea 10]